ncbi:GntR family transcriptional repressor for pyruvate dehydrogenase complex [Conyzicola lurida]|uniref:GntR family transcriptional repressor for pyruvate dehydrogenase complex n=1 Tax=Conyzicola lurida TaxID=1172621 RepID=A0A841ALJ5_9MICO|nr:FadR/GntR family transcriptional regulator [Conyzicola lurida]MBB5842345.1 GntR family transcriptional repressor for pyruvate dehydrogenase complex [Conyzicola lurida]
MPAYPGNTADQMSAAIGSVPSGTAVSAVAKRLLDYFTSGEIEPGTRLPAERQLATSLGIGRSAVREALAALEILGIVDVRPGSGTYLRGNASELLPETLSWGLMLGAPRTADLIELRAQLEVFAATLAAVNLTDRELRELGRQVEIMSETVNDRSRFIEADLKFHLQIARGSRNQVLLDLLQSIRSLLRVWVERGLQAEDDAVNALDEHRAVFEALTTRDPAAVAAAMGTHMTTASNRLGRTIDGAPELTPEP